MVKLLNDSHEMKDKILKQIVAGDRCPNRTSITIVDHDTGEILQEVHNKIVVPGGQMAAMKLWGLSRKVDFPTYDTDMKLDNCPSEPYGSEEEDNGNPIICLWCAGRDGFLSSPNEEIIVTNTDRIQPTTVVTIDGKKHTYRMIGGVSKEDSEEEIFTGMVPFRYVTATNDLDYNNREIYFGRKTFDDGYVGYYFKAFDTNPQMFISYLDSTDVDEEMWETNSIQQVEVYVETRLNINRLDFRDYFDKVLGWDHADISSISLLLAYPIESDESNNNGDYIKYYRDVIPYSKLNFEAEQLKDLDRALDFIYRVYY